MTEEAPKKKGMSGCMIAVLVVGGVGLVLVLLTVVGLVKALSSPEGQKIARFVGDSAKMMQEAQKAPGTKELRAKGCMQAMVFDMERMADLVKDLSPDAGGPPPGSEKVIITCNVGMMGTAPACDDLAKTYVEAVPTSSGSFRVTVQKQGGTHPECTALYDEKGAPKGSAKGAAQ
jgi:hypothetical protein